MIKFAVIVNGNVNPVFVGSFADCVKYVSNATGETPAAVKVNYEAFCPTMRGESEFDIERQK